ncbi:methyltransferase FkbM [Pseudomonas sp. SAS7]|uniref:methyltransferase FkbM n=1 Tax=Pseudomonas sp. SAS7 TaxID=3156487 RepID=UPI003F9DC537
MEDADEGLNAQLVPYDENLLERSRTQWQFGDWQSLAELQRETLQHHPDRAKLALLAAGAHQQLGNMTAARQFTRLAQDWGCSKKLISQVLIAGVHNTLGRATAIAGRSQQALEHFQNAVKIAAPGADVRLLVQARVREELGQLGLPALEAQQKPGPSAIRPAPEKNAVQKLSEDLQKQHATLSEQIRQQNAEMIKVRQSLERTVKSEMLNAAQQLEAFMGVQNYLNHGEHLPGMHGWPISPDFALYLVELIDGNDYDLILEFGSGTSTVVIAKALARIARQQHGKPATVQVAFEHLEQYHAQTQANLQHAELLGAVQLELAPLADFKAPNGSTYSYYSCHAALHKLAEQLTSNIKILIIVDGPPASVGKHARYPAVPSVLAGFKGAHIDILLDDYIREDEKEIVQLWLKDIEVEGLNAQMSTRKMEKDACLISIPHKV